MSVRGEPGASGAVYRVVVHLKESAGIPATISSVDLAFLAGATTTLSSHHEQPISDSNNICPARGAIDTRELTVTDTDASHPHASSVQAKVSYTDGSDNGTATASADVPPFSAPPPTPATYPLTGTITDISTHATIAGARLEILAGANAGKAATTDSSGTYTFNDLVADTFRLRASANGYDPGEQGVTVPTVPRADFELRRTSASPACSYSATGGWISKGGWVNARPTVTTSQSSCAWTASTDSNWLVLVNTGGTGTIPVYSATGSGSVPIGANVNLGLDRTATLSIRWSGGGVDVEVVQNGFENCASAITPASQNFGSAAGSGSFAVAAPATCPWHAVVFEAYSSDGEPIVQFVSVTSGSSGTGSGTVTYAVAANSSTKSRRSGVSVGGGLGLGELPFNVTQDGCPMTLSTKTISVSAAGGIQTINVSPMGAVACTWTAVSHDSFISVSSGVSGVGAATVTVTIAPNVGAARTGTLLIGGQSVSVTQAAAS